MTRPMTAATPDDVTTGDRATGDGAATSGRTVDGAVIARLGDLGRLVGRRVRVGATVAASTGDAITLRDGTGEAVVRLTDQLPAK